MTSPEVAERALVPSELRGYRRFRIAGDGLHPVVHDDGPWDPDLERARCAYGRTHDAPARGCSCGLYGWYHPADADAGSSGGDVVAVVAVRGRAVLGDHGFRAAAGRVEAVALPWGPWRIGISRSVARQTLADRYPTATVHPSVRSLVRAYPPSDVSALGVQARRTPAGRYRRAALATWLLGMVLIYAVVLLAGSEDGRPRAVGAVGGLTVFIVWQCLLVWLVSRSGTPTVAGEQLPPRDD